MTQQVSGDQSIELAVWYCRRINVVYILDLKCGRDMYPLKRMKIYLLYVNEVYDGKCLVALLIKRKKSFLTQQDPRTVSIYQHPDKNFEVKLSIVYSRVALLGLGISSR